MPHLERGVRACAWFAALALLAAAGAAGCAKKQPPRSQRVPVTVTRAESRDVPFEIVTNGTVEARQTTEVCAQVGGVVQRIAFREGDEVRAGQVLVQIDPRPYQAALAQARGALARDVAQYESARLQAERSRRLVAENYVSSEEAEQKSAAAEALRATVRADSAAVTSAALNLEYATIRAPFAGRTGNLRVHVGDLVKANDTAAPLVSLNQVRPVLVRFTIPERGLAAILARHTAPMRVEVHPGDSDSLLQAGRLVFRDNAVDPATGTLLMKGEFENLDDGLIPGQFVDLRLVVYVEKGAVVVPQHAVTTLPSGAFVYVLRPDTTVAIRPVTVARTVRNLAVVARGLQPGELVVTDGQLRLSQGSRVMVRDGKKLGLEAGR